MIAMDCACFPLGFGDGSSLWDRAQFVTPLTVATLMRFNSACLKPVAGDCGMDCKTHPAFPVKVPDLLKSRSQCCQEAACWFARKQEAQSPAASNFRYWVDRDTAFGQRRSIFSPSSAQC